MFRLAILIIFFAVTAFGAEEAVLTLDTQGHTGVIKELKITKNGEVITAGDDKTIRVWDLQTLREKRKILGQKSPDSGEIYALALSPDEKYLATGGYLDNDESKQGNIRIYDYKSGRIVKVLKSHSLVIDGLSFSEDGVYLVSSSKDKTIKVWRTADWSLVKTISGFGHRVKDVIVTKEGWDYAIYSVSYDKTVYKHLLNSGKVLAYSGYEEMLQHIAINSRHIAVCGLTTGYIDILDRDTLRLVRRISSETKRVGLAYSPEGRYLLAGATDTPYVATVYDTDANYGKTAEYRGLNYLTMAVGFINNSTIVTTGGDNYGIAMWSFGKDGVRELKKASGAGCRVLSVGIKDSRIAFGHKWTADFGMSAFEKSFDLSSMTPGRDIAGIGRIDMTGFKVETGGEYGYSNATLVLPTGAKVTRGSNSGTAHSSYGRWREYFISGGEHGFLHIYDKSGRVIANLIGHSGTVGSIALEGDRLVSGSDDQTIKIWDLKRVLNGEQTVTPMLSLFVANDNEWVIWSESGYFNSSVGGDKYIGYHINQGADKEALFVSSDKYFSKLYRPDIIENILKTGSEEKAVAYANVHSRVQKVDISQSLPPVIFLKSPDKVTTQEDRATVQFTVESSTPIMLRST